MISKQELTSSYRAVATDGGTLCFLTYRVMGTFGTRFDLRHYPFDTQALRVEAVLWGCPWEAILSDEISGSLDQPTLLFQGRPVFSNELSFLYAEHNVVGDMWNMKGGVRVWGGLTDHRRRAAQDGVRHVMIHTDVVVQRRHHSVLLNSMAPFCLFVSLAFLSMTPKAEKMVDKTGITLNMVLTSSAFKIVVGQSLPAVAYLTVADKYILFCFTTMGLVAIQNVLSVHSLSDNSLNEVETPTKALFFVRIRYGLPHLPPTFRFS